MALRTVVEDIEEIPESLRDEYIPKDGKFVLAIEGDVPGLVPNETLAEANAKLAKFRDNNTALMKELDELKPMKEQLTSQMAQLQDQLKAFEGVDPEEYRKLKSLPKRTDEDHQIETKRAIEAAVGPLQKRIDELTAREREAEEREQRAAAALARKTLEGELTKIGLELGVDEKAIPDYVRRGLEVFVYDDGEILAQKADGTPIYSPMNPTSPMTAEEWAQNLMDEAPHLFKGSGGGGAEADRDHDYRPAPRKQIENDPLEFGRNLEGIARGEVKVRPA